MPAGTPPRISLPIVIDATNNTFQIDEGGGALNCAIVAGTYYWRGDGTAADFCEAIEAALDGGGAWNYDVAINVSGVLGITAAGGAWSLLWGTGVHLLNPAWLGFADADYASGGGGNLITSPYQVLHGWWPEQDYIEDTESNPVPSAALAFAMSGRNVGLSYGGRTFRAITIDQVPPRKVYTAEEVRTQEAFQRAVFPYLYSGGHFEFTPSTAVPAAWAKYVIRDIRWVNASLDQVFVLHEQLVRRYLLTLPLQLYVP